MSTGLLTGTCVFLRVAVATYALQHPRADVHGRGLPSPR